MQTSNGLCAPLAGRLQAPKERDSAPGHPNRVRSGVRPHLVLAGECCAEIRACARVPLTGGIRAEVGLARCSSAISWTIGRPRPEPSSRFQDTVEPLENHFAVGLWNTYTAVLDFENCKLSTNRAHRHLPPAGCTWIALSTRFFISSRSSTGFPSMIRASCAASRPRSMRLTSARGKDPEPHPSQGH